MHIPIRFKLKTTSLLSASIASAIFTTYSANAQEATPEITAITVTGSRIVRDGYDMPTPVSVLSKTDIDAEVPASIAEFAMTLPSIQGSTTATTNSGSLSSG